MQSILAQATHALQLGRYTSARELVQEALVTPETAVPQLPLLEILAQAQAGLQDHVAAAHTWQQAYARSTSPVDSARLFEQTAQAYQQIPDYTALHALARQHLRWVRTSQERAACLLMAGEALLHLRQYAAARRQYLEPAMRLADAMPETRAYLWHSLGLSYLPEHAFPAAAAAFRQSAEFVLGLYYARRMTHAPAPAARLHHVRNTAHFYDAVIHLLYQRPQQTVLALQRLQRPFTTTGTLNRTLYLALAHRHLQEPETADRLLQTLHRGPELPKVLQGPVALVCAGVANLRQHLAAVGTHLEVALEAPLGPHLSWEPTWRAVLYRELGLALQHAGYRAAALACYEEGLKEVVRRTDNWQDAQYSAWLRGASLLTALENLPQHTWSATLRGELSMLLQGLAWLAATAQEYTRADAALSLALRLATTAEQQSALWLQRGWLAATMSDRQAGVAAEMSAAEIYAGVQQARAQCSNASLARVLHGIEALMRGDLALAQECFGAVPALPESPETQALCVAAWLWSQARAGTLSGALQSARQDGPRSWLTDTTLRSALERLLAWTARQDATATEAMVAWLGPVLTHHGAGLLPVLRRWCQSGHFPAVLQAALSAALLALMRSPVYAALADDVADMLGGAALQERLAVLLARLDASTRPTPSASRRPQLPAHAKAETSDLKRVLRLIRLLQSRPSPSPDTHLPDRIYHWLVRFPQLGARAPEVVSTLLGVLRQCPAAPPVIQRILDQVTLSRRQREGLAAALPTALPAATHGVAPLEWEPMRHWSLAQLLEELQSTLPPSQRACPARSARTWYGLALLLSRVGLLTSAADCLQACVTLLPEQPLAHFMLGQVLRLQHRYTAALQATQQAWQTLSTQVPQPHVLHCEVLNQLLILLGVTQQYNLFPAWAAVCEHWFAACETTALSAAQQQRRQEEAGEFALSRALHLASLPARQHTDDTFAQQRQFLTQAIAQGAPSTRHFALHRQAEAYARLQHHDEAAAVYTSVLQQWPADRGARFRLTLLTAVRQAAVDVPAADHAFTEALSLAFTEVNPVPTPLTPQTALCWLQRATRRDAGYTEVVDVLTTWAGMALKRQELPQAIEVLTALHACVAQPRHAYYLAKAYHRSSQQAASVAAQVRDGERAMAYAQQALAGGAPAPLTHALMEQIQQRLAGTRTLHTAVTDYRTRICQLFQHAGIRFQAEDVEPPPEAPWLTLHECIEIDEASGNLLVLMRLCFHGPARSTTPLPSVADVTQYVQHQQDVQRLVDTHGMDTLPWPQTAYTGATAFDLIFSERLALNRDLVFLAHAEYKALWRYAQVLEALAQTWAPLLTAPSAPPMSTAIAVARYTTIFPLLLRRLGVLATRLRTKNWPQQWRTSQEDGTFQSQCAPLHTLPAFQDASTYFQEIAGALHPLLDTPPAGALPLPKEPDVSPHPPVPRRTKPPRSEKRTRQLPPGAAPERL